MIIPFKRRSSHTLILFYAKMGACLTLVLSIISYFFLDRSIAKAVEHLPFSLYELCSFLTVWIDPKVHLLLWPVLYFVLLYVVKKPKFAKIALILLVAVPLADVACELIKWVCARPRPELYLSSGIYGFDCMRLSTLFQSFPSGHATIAGVIGGIFACIRPKWTFYFLGGSLILASTRIWLNVHYLSDVLAGVFLGALIAQWTYVKMKG